MGDSDADEAPGIPVPIGDEVGWSYEVTNLGNTPLIDITVVDDQGVDVTCPATVVGVGESMTCVGEPEAVVAGPYTNIGSVEAVPGEPCDCPDGFAAVLDPTTGEPVAPVTADDPANHFGVDATVEISKEVCDLDDVADCDSDDDAHWVETTVVPDGDAAAWRISVTNTGNVELVDVAVTDALASDCDWTQASLDVGQSVTYESASGSVTSPMVNTAVVTAVDVTSVVGEVTASDEATITPPPELALTKTASVTNANEGDRVTYTITVTNQGAGDASEVEIDDTLPAGLGSPSLPRDLDATYDATGHAVTWKLAELAAGESATMRYVVSVNAVGSLVNTAAIGSAHEETDIADNQASATIAASAPPRVLAFTGSSTLDMVLFALLVMVMGFGLTHFARLRPTEE